MTKKGWKKKYIAYLIVAGMEDEYAHNCFYAMGGEIDYEIDPEDAAGDELSYWTD